MTLTTPAMPGAVIYSSTNPLKRKNLAKKKAKIAFETRYLRTNWPGTRTKRIHQSFVLFDTLDTLRFETNAVQVLIAFHQQMRHGIVGTELRGISDLTPDVPKRWLIFAGADLIVALIF